MSHVLAPPVEGIGHRSNPPLVSRPEFWTHLAGSTIGGLLLGVLWAIAGLALGPQLAVSCGVGIAVLASLSIFRQRPTALWPHRRAQVPTTWMAWSDMKWTTLAWGVLLGVGVLSPLTTPAFYVLVGLAIAQKSWLFAVGLGLSYGALRGLSVIPRARASVRVGIGPPSRRARLSRELLMRNVLGGASALAIVMTIATVR